jgi:elongation factor 1-alpha
MENTIKIATTGNVDSGKTTLTGVLVNRMLDDGRGGARNTIVKIKHELESGRTSQISFNYLKYTEKIITMVDLAGHEKYLKTTLYGLNGMFIDYALVIVSAEDGVIGTTKEHLGILIHLKIPIIIIVTKIDRAPEQIYNNTLTQLRKIFKIKSIKKTAIFINKDTRQDQAFTEIKKYTDIVENTDRIVPIISVSNITGQNIDIINNLLSNLKPRSLWNKDDYKGTVFTIDAPYQVKGIGLVLSGTIQGQDIRVQQDMLLGPLKNGKFIPFRIRSMHNNIQENVDTLSDKHSGCLAIKFMTKEFLTRKQIKKGMVAISHDEYNKNICWEFKAEITILQHSTTICNNYQPVIHCNSVRQVARIIIENDKVLRVNDSAIVTFRFLYNPEFLLTGSKIFFRDGITKGIGRIIEIVPII